MPDHRSIEIDDHLEFYLAEKIMEYMKMTDRPDFSNVKALFLDFDGVVTDNTFRLDKDKNETVRCDRSDGFAVERLKKAGIMVFVISKEKHPVVTVRCEKLGIECVQGIDDKLPLMKKEAEKHGLAMDEVAFMGNDVNDIECIRSAGIGIAVNDAYPDVLRAADYITSRRGGNGAIREVADFILEDRNLPG